MNKYHRSISPEIIAEAAEWLVEMQSEEWTTEKQKQFEAWKSQGEEYLKAWQQAEQLQDYLHQLPNDLNQQIFDQHQFRYLSQKFIWIFVFMGAVLTTSHFVHKNALLADQRTGYGEQRTVMLEDGSKLILNSKTAIDIDFSATERHVKLHYGELYIETGKDTTHHHRPFKVLSQQGSILALGTQFNVRQQQHQTETAVIEHAVLIENKAGQKQKVYAGQQTPFNSQYVGQPRAVNLLDLAWRNHLLIADRIPLSEFARQVEKNYGVSIELDDQIQNIIISGAYPSNNLTVLQETLAEVYHLKVEQRTFPQKIIFKAK